MAVLALALSAPLVSSGCQGASSENGAEAEPEAQAAAPLFLDVTGTHLPSGILEGLSMDAGVGDVDGDGDLDIVIANEFRPNILLVNDGKGRFSDGSHRLPRTEHDSEDVGIADFDGDGDLDIVIVSEDDQVNELYVNDDAGGFTDESARIPVTGTTNETTARLPVSEDVTQDLELGDVDGDGDPDLVVGNEGPNGLYINDGTAHFTDESRDRIPLRDTPEETREADFGDVDGDGDLDILFANVGAFVAGADVRNRLLINDGRGYYTDETDARLPPDSASSFDGDFRDVDGDGDLDILTGNSDVDLSQRRIADSPYRAYLNDGSGRFSVATEQVFGEGVTGTGFDLEYGDFNGDGLEDIFLASRGTRDRLLLRNR
jgi:hypothetical protein